MKTRYVVVLVLVVFLWGTMGGIGGAAVEVPEPSTKVTLDMWFQDWSGGIKWQKTYAELFEKKHPNIHINVIPVPFEELFTKLIPSIAQRNEADILFGYDDWVIGKDVSKLFLPLTPTLLSAEELKELVFEAPLKHVTGSDGNIYGYPFLTGGNAFGFVYHKDLFREAGVDAATIKSWDDIKVAAQKLTVHNPDGSIKRSGILFSYTEAANAFLDMIIMQGAKDKLLNPATREWNFNIEEARKALETFQWFVDNKLYDPTSGDPSTSFPNKLGAMLLNGPWRVGAVMTDFPELEVGFFMMPPFPTADTPLQIGAICHWGTYFLSRRLEGDKKNAGLIFMKELIEDPVSYYEIPFNAKPPYWVGALSNKKGVAQLKAKEAELNEFARTALVATEVGLPALSPLDTKISEAILIRNVLFPEMQEVFLGRKSIDEALKYLTEYLTSREKELAE
jgi:ABC-type glycerol-3-phosphate transport system substrate-binding protein